MSAILPLVPVRDGDPIRSEDWNAMQSGLRGALTGHDHAARPLNPGVFGPSAALRLGAAQAASARVGDTDLAALAAGALPGAGGEVEGDLRVSGDVTVRGSFEVAPQARGLVTKSVNESMGLSGMTSRLAGTDPNLNHQGAWTLGLYTTVRLESRSLLALLSVGSFNNHRGLILQHAVGIEELVLPIHAFAFFRAESQAELMDLARAEQRHPQSGWRPILDAGYGAAHANQGTTFELLQWVELPPGEYTIGLAALGPGGIVNYATFSLSYL